MQIYECATKILNKEPAAAPKTNDSYGNSYRAICREEAS